MFIKLKLTELKPSDMDLVIDCESEKELFDVVYGLFEYLNRTNVENFTDPLYFKRPNIDSVIYGKIIFLMYGEEIDLEIMSSSRKVIFPYSFVSTKNFTEDALSRDCKVNAIAYNLREGKIEDPLNGIEDMRKGVLTPANELQPLGIEFFRVFSLFKTSAAGLRIDEKLHNFITENDDIIKEFLLYYRSTRTCHKFRKITDEEENEYSIRAFKILCDYTFIDVFIPIEYFACYLYRKEEFRNKIFNMALVSEFLMKYSENSIYSIKAKQKHYIYNEIFYLAFQDENHLNFFYDTFKDNKIPINEANHKAILTTAKKYCERINCTQQVLTKIDLRMLSEIVNDII